MYRSWKRLFLDMISFLPPPSCCFLNFAILPRWVPFPFLPCGFKCLLSTSTLRGTSGLLTAKPTGDLSLLTPEDHILLGHRSACILSRPPPLLISRFPVWRLGFSNFSSVLPVSWHSMEFCPSAMLYYITFSAYFNYQQLSLQVPPGSSGSEKGACFLGQFTR